MALKAKQHKRTDQSVPITPITPSTTHVITAQLTSALTSSLRPRHHCAILAMVEGHQCARVIHWHRTRLQGRKFSASSPNSRFTEGASLINGCLLTRCEHIGKNLFYFFTPPPPSSSLDNASSVRSTSTTVVHVHFGMSGRFKTFATDAEPETTATTRLRLIAEDNSIGGHLSAMTVKHGGIDLFESKMAELGPDPLREDADANRFFDKLESSRFKAKPVGLALMDQNTVAGIGNIYRAEILFRAGIHPEEPCGNLTREQLQTIWNESVVCLRRGFETGSILTVDPKEGLPEPWTRRYIYNHKSCGRCGGAVKSWDMANRTAYACAGTCQPLLIKGGVSALPEARQKAFKAAKQHTSFVSHCAPEPKPTKKKAAEAAAAAAAVQEAEPSEDVDDAIGAMKMPQTPASRALVTSTAETPPQKAGKQLQKPGTSRGRRMVGPADAAQEKERAGEKKNVEHVALEDGMDEGRTTSNARRSKRARKL